MLRRLLKSAAALAVIAFPAAGPAHAAYPERTITVVCASGAGGAMVPSEDGPRSPPPLFESGSGAGGAGAPGTLDGGADASIGEPAEGGAEAGSLDDAATGDAPAGDASPIVVER